MRFLLRNLLSGSVVPVIHLLEDFLARLDRRKLAVGNLVEHLAESLGALIGIAVGICDNGRIRNFLDRKLGGYP